MRRYRTLTLAVGSITALAAACGSGNPLGTTLTVGNDPSLPDAMTPVSDARTAAVDGDAFDAGMDASDIDRGVEAGYFEAATDEAATDGVAPDATPPEQC